MIFTLWFAILMAMFGHILFALFFLLFSLVLRYEPFKRLTSRLAQRLKRGDGSLKLVPKMCLALALVVGFHYGTWYLVKQGLVPKPTKALYSNQH